MSANTKDDVIEPVLIGPVGVGKTTISRKLGQKLGLPVVSMDDHRDDYYRELGYDDGFAKHLLEKDGAASLWCYLKAFDPHSIERLLDDYPGHVIDMGGGSSVHEHVDQFERVSAALSRHKNIVLLLPYRNNDESLRFLNDRTGWSNEGRNVNRIILEHPSSYELATMTTYTGQRSPDEVATEIVGRIETAR